jgi:hypothetical protein
MANPNPAHNPTDGLGSAVSIVATASAVALTALHTPATGKPYPGIYTVTLSLANSATTTVTPTLVDVNNTAYSATSGSWIYRAFASTAGDSAAFGGSGGTAANTPNLAPKFSYKAGILSVGASGASTCLITALAVGQAVVEIDYPVYDNPLAVGAGSPGGLSGGASMAPQSVAVQIIVTVTT